jgi:hypothetical protein
MAQRSWCYFPFAFIPNRELPRGMRRAWARAFTADTVRPRSAAMSKAGTFGDDELPKSLIFVCGPGLRGVYFFRSQLSHKPYCGKITTHAISFSLRLQLRSPHSREAGSNGFHRTLEVRGNKYQRFTRINKFEQPSILLRCPFCSAVLHSHQERNSPVFVFGPGRERANLILSMRARLRIDE